jgi:hypothetical protein
MGGVSKVMKSTSLSSGLEEGISTERVADKSFGEFPSILNSADSAISRREDEFSPSAEGVISPISFYTGYIKVGSKNSISGNVKAKGEGKGEKKKVGLHSNTKKGVTKKKNKIIAQLGFDPRTFGL